MLSFKNKRRRKSCMYLTSIPDIAERERDALLFWTGSLASCKRVKPVCGVRLLSYHTQSTVLFRQPPDVGRSCHRTPIVSLCFVFKSFSCAASLWLHTPLSCVFSHGSLLCDAALYMLWCRVHSCEFITTRHRCTWCGRGRKQDKSIFLICLD